MDSWRRLLCGSAALALAACSHAPPRPFAAPDLGAPSAGGAGQAEPEDVALDLEVAQAGAMGEPKATDPDNAPEGSTFSALSQASPAALAKVHRVPGRLLVGFKASSTLGIQASLGARSVADVPAISMSVIDVAPGQEASVTAALQADPAVAYVEPDYRVPSAAVEEAALFGFKAPKEVKPNDPGFSKQWGLLKIGATRAWGVTTGSSAITVAILDSGIDQDHEDLTSKVVGNKNFSDSPTLDDTYGHGTHVAGIVAAATNNRLGVAGTGFNTRLLNVKVVSDDGWVDIAAAAQGIVWAAERKAKVLNMSFASVVSSKALQSAVKYAARKGAVLVASAGNDSHTAVTYPAGLSEVIAVGATDARDQKAVFSNYGSSWVDVAAPGDEIYSTGPNHPNAFGFDGYGSLSGTSMAAAFVSGEAALLFARRAFTPVRWRIERNTDRVAGTGKYYRYGRINLQKAVSSL